MLWFFIRNLNLQNAVFIWLLQLFVLISNRVLKLRQSLLLFSFVFLLFFRFYCLFCAAFTANRPAVHLLLTTGLFYSQQKSNLVCHGLAPPHLPLPLCLLPSQLLLLLVFSSLSFCLSHRRNSNKAFRVVADTPLALALQFYNDSSSSRQQQQEPQQWAKQQWQQQGPRIPGTCLMVCGFYAALTGQTLKSTLKVRFTLVALLFLSIIMAIKFVLADRAYTWWPQIMPSGFTMKLENLLR